MNYLYSVTLELILKSVSVKGNKSCADQSPYTSTRAVTSFILAGVRVSSSSRSSDFLKFEHTAPLHLSSAAHSSVCPS